MAIYVLNAGLRLGLVKGMQTRLSTKPTFCASQLRGWKGGWQRQGLPLGHDDCLPFIDNDAR
jgi:hypothetical protein